VLFVPPIGGRCPAETPERDEIVVKTCLPVAAPNAAQVKGRGDCGSRVVRHLAAAAGAAVLAALVLLPATPAAAATCAGTVDNDFNGDGVRDVASADPQAAVGSAVAAGAITIVYGSTGTVQTLHQDSAGVPGAVEAGDQFGYSLTSYDSNSDGCSDLLVGIPFEDIGTEVDAGTIAVLYGSVSGLTLGSTAAVGYDQSMTAVPGAAEAGDWFGFSVAASETTAGVPFAVVGLPGEDLGTIADAGSAMQWRAGIFTAFDQAASDYPDTDSADASTVMYEANDRYGYSVAADPYHVAIGAPGESIAGAAFTGELAIYSTTLNSSSQPSILWADNQLGSAVSGAAEGNDLMGTSVSMAVYHPSGASSLLAQSLLAVGLPGEDIAENGVGFDSAGRVVVLVVSEAGVVSELREYAQNITDVDDSLADGDQFGQQVMVVNRSPSAYSTAANVLLVVGVPGEDSSAADAGQLQVFPLVGAAGAADVVVRAGTVGLPGSPAKQEFLGLSFSASSSNLYVATPYAGQVVYAVPWANVLSAGTATPTAYAAGTGGVAFGAAIS